MKDRILFATMHGSIAYGLNTPESDVDIRGFCSIPKEYVFGFVDNFDQWIASEPYDSTIYNVKKFIKLASQGNPSMMEILFTSEKHHLHVTDMGRLLLDNKELFLHAGLKERYIGYAKSQAHRIRSHRKFLLNPPKEKPTRESVGLKEMAEITKNEYGMIKSLVNAKLEEWNPSFEPFSESQKIYLQNKLSDILNEFHITKDEQWVAACRHIGLDDKLIHVMQLEKQYENRLNEWNQYNEWKKNRNKKRAAIEEKFHYDCKHGMQLCRLLRMGKEILSTGQVIVERIHDREELLAVKNGAWTYEQLLEYVAKTENEVELAAKTSTLPNQPNMKKLDGLCQNIVESSL